MLKLLIREQFLVPNIVQYMEIGLNLDYGCHVQRAVEMEQKGVLDSVTIQYLHMVVIIAKETILKTQIAFLIVLKVSSDHENSSDSIAQHLFYIFSIM